MLIVILVAGAGVALLVQSPPFEGLSVSRDRGDGDAILRTHDAFRLRIVVVVRSAAAVARSSS